MRVGIIGAGFAGLSTAKVLRTFGHEVLVFEKEPDVGGVWAASRRYPGLTTQNPRDTYALSDFPMPRSYPEWPSGAQVQAYMADYARHFGLEPFLRLSCEIVRAWPDQGEWVLEARGPDGVGEHRFDHLVVASGIFSEPAIPAWTGAEAHGAAGGRVLHTSQFTDLEAARGRSVLIVGYGKSSCDAAAAAADVASATALVARDIIWKIPKRFAGVLNYKNLLLTRMGEGLFRYVHLRGFERFLHGPGLPVRNAMLGSIEALVTRQFRLRKLGLHPGKPLETIARSTVSLASDGFFEAVAAGAITVERGAEIAELGAEEGRPVARLSSGKRVPADLVVCGTGWRQRVPFLGPETLARVTDHRGNFRLYRSMAPVGVPGLTFNGFNSSFFSQLNAEIGALWIAAYLADAVAMPTATEQNRTIDERLAWMEARTDGKHSKGTNIIPFSVHHIDELLSDLGVGVGRATHFAEWLRPIDPGDYAKLTPALLRRVRARAGRPGGGPQLNAESGLQVSAAA